jgi:TatD DNase family protein
MVSKAQALAAEMSQERILTETDGPFAQVDGRPALSWDVGRAVEVLSQLWGTPRQDTQDRLPANLKSLRVGFRNRPEHGDVIEIVSISRDPIRLYGRVKTSTAY